MTRPHHSRVAKGVDSEASVGPELAIALMNAAGVCAGHRGLDVGCGGGALTEPLSDLLGLQNAAAVDPDPVAVEACRARLPDPGFAGP